MLPAELLRALTSIVGQNRVRLDAPLAPFTTFRVGGPADCLVEALDAGQVAAVVSAARGAGVPLTMLGGGSNVVVSDAGVRGVVVRAHGGRITEEGAAPGGGVAVRSDGGVTVNALVRWTIARGLAGLEAWAGTPGTIGGAVYGNAHFAGRNIGDLVLSVRAVSGDGRDVVDIGAEGLAFGYDASRFQSSAETILSAVLALRPGSVPSRLRDVARESLAHRKRTQPLHVPSAGCAFQNPDPSRDTVPAGLPASAGALIDRAGLKGHVIGGARVSPLHANFIVSDGSASAADIRALVRLCQAEVRRRFGVDLREEIRWVGEFTVDK
jgi:UDP-N-acetylmuramate dehydrogenase